MTNTKHTPAPWQVIDGMICDAYQMNVLSPRVLRLTPDTYDARLRLIAAAPELLDALQDLLEEIPTEAWEALPQYIQQKAIKAISKTKG